MSDEQIVPPQIPTETEDNSPDSIWVPSKETEYLIAFTTPRNPTLEERTLARDVVILDHRARHQLRPMTRDWDEVSKLLYNVVVCLQARDAARGQFILQEATKIYFHHNQTRNRILYLTGALIGILAGALIAGGLLVLPKTLAPYVGSQLLVLIFVFAGLGSIASVLTRLSSIDLQEETSRFSVFISGLSRPFIAMVLALVVYLIMDLKLVEIRFGNPSDQHADAIYLVTSFLCGFTERFANDIISRVPFAHR